MTPLNTPRYAVYFAPGPGTPLKEFGDSIFATGRLPADTVGLTAEGWKDAPQRYGFHATLKAPFHLRAGHDETDICQAARIVAALVPGLQIARLTVTLVDDFIALTPAHASSEPGLLAQACVRGFDHLRAPLTEQDRARRLATGLSAQEIAYLDAWGYPYVFDHFQFHMTLTGPLAPKDAEPMQRALAHYYAPFDGPVDIDAITICRQPSRDARFEIWQRFELASALE
jgi:Protein of unknown function (DUF1045)